MVGMDYYCQLWYQRKCSGSGGGMDMYYYVSYGIREVVVVVVGMDIISVVKSQEL